MRNKPGVLIALIGVLFAAALLAAGAASIERFHRINNRVAVGGQPTPEQIQALADEGFNAVINLREEIEYNDAAQARAARESGMAFIRVPVSREEPSDAAVEKFIAATEDQAIYPIYIHCAQGHRAAAFWMIRRVMRDGWSLASAEIEAKRAGLPEGKMLDFARNYVYRHENRPGRAGR